MYKYIKRLLDIIMGIILFIILLPVMIITGIIVFIEVGIPIFYEITPREGRYKKPFQMYKFRTKTLGTQGMADHIRYTKVTKFLDITRINEFPQLWNIIRGDMSFVGPRPFIVGEKLPDCTIPEERYLIRPGVMGLYQSKSGRMGTHQAKLDADLEYYHKMSFTLDVKIVVSTPILVIKNLFVHYKK